ncbi:hypothetical protein Trydic_g11614 [Trypoxylus dichotomus]
MSAESKVRIYKTTLKAVLIYAAETRRYNKSEEHDKSSGAEDTCELIRKYGLNERDDDFGGRAGHLLPKRLNNIKKRRIHKTKS